MPFDLVRFINTRPRLYHLTARSNAPLIQADGQLRPAIEILREAGRVDLLNARRKRSEVVTIGSKSIHIRDQSPLHAGNLSLDGGWQFDRFVRHLNEHVFFWPGTTAGPIDYGRRHFERYATEDNVVLVFSTEEIFAANLSLAPRFCKYNSGSPRCTGGKPSPRGSGTFMHADQLSFAPSNVVEVVFPGPVTLPNGKIRAVTPQSLV